MNYPNDFLKNCLKPVTPSRTNSEREISSAMGFAVVPYNQGVTGPIKIIF